MSFFCLYVIDKRTNYILNKYVDVEVERLTTNIVNNTINEKLVENKIDKIDYYDTNKFNILRKDITDSIEEKLINLDNGKIDKYFIFERIKNGRFKKIKNGYLCDISIGSMKNSVLFGNIGPSIPIKLVFASQINSKIDIDIKEYGINNVIVKTNLIVEIKEQINMPLTSKRKTIVIKEPLSIDIVQGKIPNYYYIK